jgi:SurA N-terminal domain
MQERVVTTVVRRLAIALLALTTAACALTNTGDPSVAATVGDVRLATSQIDRFFESISSSEAYQQQPQQDDMQVQLELVTFLVRSEVFEYVAERNDVQVTDAQIDAAVEDQIERAGGRDAFEQNLSQQGISEDLFVELVRGQELQTAVQEEVGEGDFLTFVREQSADLEVEVNPRYGEWNANNLTVQPTDPLPVPGEQASASPAP